MMIHDKLKIFSKEFIYVFDKNTFPSEDQRSSLQIPIEILKCRETEIEETSTRERKKGTSRKKGKERKSI